MLSLLLTVTAVFFENYIITDSRHYGI